MHRYFIVVVVSILFLSGCATYTAGIHSPMISQSTSSTTLTQGENSLLARQVKINQAGLQPLSNGRREAFVTLQSMSHYNQQLQYRFVWYNQDKEQVLASAWLPILLSGNEQVQVKSVAIKAQASQFRIDIRLINNGE